MEEIFYSDTDELTGRHIVIEESNGFIWTYLTFPNRLEIAQRCFLGSRFEIQANEFNAQEYKKKKSPPPIIKEFSTVFTNLGNIREEGFSIRWYKNGNVLLFIQDSPFLFFIDKESLGYSQAVRKNGIYGNAWNHTKYQRIAHI